MAALPSLPCFESHIVLPSPETSLPKRAARGPEAYLVYPRQCTSTLYSDFERHAKRGRAYSLSSFLFFLEGSYFPSCDRAWWAGILAVWHSQICGSVLCWPRVSVDCLAVWWLAHEMRGGISSEWAVVCNCLLPAWRSKSERQRWQVNLMPDREESQSATAPWIIDNFVTPLHLPSPTRAHQASHTS